MGSGGIMSGKGAEWNLKWQSDIYEWWFNMKGRNTNYMGGSITRWEGRNKVTTL